MNPILKNIIAVVVGWFIGSVVNMGLIVLGHSIFPIEGVDINDTAALSEVMPTLEYNYFIFPFLAHALGTFVGATIAGMIAANRKMTFAMVIGGLFFIFGIIAHNMISGPTWFTVFDLVAAYIPMAWLGGKLALKLSKKD